MALRRFLRDRIDPWARAWRTVQRCQKMYEQSKGRHPNMEPHQLLGCLWHATRRIRRRTRHPDLHKPAFAATYLYACVPPPDGARALGLWVLSNTRPEIAEKYPCFSEEYSRLMNPVFEAQQKGQLDVLYRRHNPRLAEGIEWQPK